MPTEATGGVYARSMNVQGDNRAGDSLNLKPTFETCGLPAVFTKGLHDEALQFVDVLLLYLVRWDSYMYPLRLRDIVSRIPDGLLSLLLLLHQAFLSFPTPHHLDDELVQIRIG